MVDDPIKLSSVQNPGMKAIRNTLVWKARRAYEEAIAEDETLKLFIEQMLKK
ncbi:hypothetical protein SS50377_22843 [Spironucleus salmonicida]|uniref:Uncharacterized protein n=1 Tax=Spironucleus salmonicida TaxID=348837 RepID=V6LUG5_9EUKA|nr:hypothetical protein SS50377_22843 [Spironucleus salmonicida]|eukprot:EST47903.1 Hypothetical protein SS50377_12006 [Spironucleus salmonicida]